MKLTIVYDSRTGTTEAAAKEMAEIAQAAGHDVSTVAVQSATPEDIAAADAVCIGSWTEGLFFFRQHATKATMDFISALRLDGTPAAVFCTYKTSPGKLLEKMAAALDERGAKTTGRFRSRGRHAPEGFRDWLESVPVG